MKSKISPFSAFKIRDFRLLWLGLLISRIGSEMQVVAVSWQVYLLTGSAFSLGIIGLARFLPVLFFSLIGGVAADRYDRRKVMLFSQIAMAFFSVVLAITTWNGTVSASVIYLMIAANSLASVFDTPARQSIVPLLVPKKQFVNAISLTTTMWHAAIVLGPTISGFTIASLGIASVYIINAVSFIASIISLLLLKRGGREVATRTSFSLTDITEGLSFVFKTPLMISSMLLDFFATFFSSATVLLPIFAKDILQVGPQGLGILYAAPSIGAISGGLLISSFNKINKQGKLLITGVLIYGLSTFFFGFTRNFLVSLIFLFFTGFGDVISTIIRNTIRQMVTPDYLRGRMVSVNMIFFMGGPQLGEVEAGFLAATVGAPLSVSIGGLGTILITLLIAYFVPKLRKYEGHEVIMS
ncbi:hypothetical protein A3D78_05440 [Candidatus Gottesmanbacteria bacterium RIFCSPHIGHO2_02_FULL_39_14]|uniref:Major facilitator superfamily (MFS) profile domain-containing protein n=2 Tax=Candidatus Gottesmaniibacteriota TaxID=1752720 RepID=A0A1F6A477_9BACT|nr:MAG: hypothetical protein A3D78_05440 [Candidatus Gottesmanbacteria bacterium RIFCSPHIGHO2_02_FULL_39_14]